MTRPLFVPGLPPTALPPDLSKGWRQTTAFFSDAVFEGNREMIQALRKVDPKRAIIVDQKSRPYAVERIIPMLRKYDAALKNEGSPDFRSALLQSMAAQAGVPFFQELHNHIPTSRSIADATNFWSAHLSKGINWLLRWKPGQVDAKSPIPMFRTLPTMLDYLARTQPHWQGFIKADYVKPQVLVLGSRADEMLGGPRRGFYDDIAGKWAYAALFEWNQVPVQFADEYTTWVDPDNFKLVFACGEVLSRDAAQRLADYAQHGGKLVLVGDVGRYTPDQPGQRDWLSKQVGSLPNVRRIDAPNPVKQATLHYEWARPRQFKANQVDDLLRWADVHRPARVVSEKLPGFQVQVRVAKPGSELYVAVMRSWYGWYHTNVEYEKRLKKKWGTGGGELTVYDLPQGKWHVQKLHRKPRDLGVLQTEADGSVKIKLDPALAGEVELFRIDRVESK